MLGPASDTSGLSSGSVIFWHWGHHQPKLRASSGDKQPGQFLVANSSGSPGNWSSMELTVAPAGSRQESYPQPRLQSSGPTSQGVRFGRMAPRVPHASLNQKSRGARLARLPRTPHVRRAVMIAKNVLSAPNHESAPALVIRKLGRTVNDLRRQSETWRRRRPLRSENS